MKILFVALSACIAFSGCASQRPSAEPALGGLATTSALVVALPLIPFAEVYHAASGDVRKARERAEAIREKFDPIYSERIRLIEARDPLKDAELFQKEGVIALLPSIPDGHFFPGLEKLGYDFSLFSENAGLVRRNQMLDYLQTLMSRDPAEDLVAKNGIHYSSLVYNAFQKATWQYKTVFNREMYGKRKQK